jgi:hypothetical protein
MRGEVSGRFVTDDRLIKQLSAELPLHKEHIRRCVRGHGIIGAVVLWVRSQLVPYHSLP